MSSCAICLEPELNSPAACVPCGHTFCHACITQWTRSPPRFGLSLCPQCRSPVREVQKLFISDWPVASGSTNGQPGPSQQSPWQQFMQMVTLMGQILSIPLHAAAHYGPEMVHRVTVWANQQAERLIVLRSRLVRCAVVCHREWQDLGRPAQCMVGAALLLVALLLVQDLQDQDGIHRGIVLPILLVLVDIVKRLLAIGAYALYRPLTCCLACSAEVAAAAVDIGAEAVLTVVWVVYDVLCIPWMVVCVAARLACAALSALAGFVRVCLFFTILAVSLGVPTFLAAPGNQALRAQLPELAQAGVEWVRRALLHLTQHAVPVRRPGEGEDPGSAAPRENFLREFFRLLSEELRREDGEEGEGEGEVMLEGEGERDGERGRVEERDGGRGRVEAEGGTAEGVFRSASALRVGEALR